LTKQQIFQTDVNQSVENIMNPTIPLALRLSGHLLLGVCRIHSRQVQYLVFDCEDAFTKINYSFRPGQVDLPEGPQVSQGSITLQPDLDAVDRTMFSTAFLDGIDELYATQHSFTRLPRTFTPSTPVPGLSVPSTIVPAERITLADTSAIRRSSLRTPDDFLGAGKNDWDEDFELPTPEMARRDAATPTSAADVEMARSNLDLPVDAEFDVAMSMGFDELPEAEPEADTLWRRASDSAEPSALERATNPPIDEASPLRLDQTPVRIDEDITWKLPMPRNPRKRQARTHAPSGTRGNHSPCARPLRSSVRSMIYRMIYRQHSTVGKALSVVGSFGDAFLCTAEPAMASRWCLWLCFDACLCA
jgi:hypothetical protein